MSNRFQAHVLFHVAKTVILLGIVSNQRVIFDRIEADDLLFLRGIPSIELNQLWGRWERWIFLNVCCLFDSSTLLGVLDVVIDEIVLANHNDVSMFRFRFCRCKLLVQPVQEILLLWSGTLRNRRREAWFIILLCLILMILLKFFGQLHETPRDVWLGSIT